MGYLVRALVRSAVLCGSRPFLGSFPFPLGRFRAAFLSMLSLNSRMSPHPHPPPRQLIPNIAAVLPLLSMSFPPYQSAPDPRTRSKTCFLNVIQPFSPIAFVSHTRSPSPGCFPARTLPTFCITRPRRKRLPRIFGLFGPLPQTRTPVRERDSFVFLVSLPISGIYGG